MNKKKSNVKALGVFVLAMINVAAVLSLRNLPPMAEFGWSSIGWYLIGTITFLIPLSLAGAELATGWPKGGGVYAWVQEAFGDKSGFIAVFCEWSNNLVWFPTILAFLASTFAFVIDPALVSNGLYMFVVMMIIFWGTTLIALLGSKVSSRYSSYGVIVGTLVPAGLVIVLGVVYMFAAKSIQLPPFTLGAMMPTINLSTLPFLATIVLMFAGMEMAGFHALEVRDPQKDYPKAMLLSALVIFVLTVVGTLAVAIVIPLDKLKLSAGLMQAFQAFLAADNLTWLLAPMAILVVVGGIPLLAAWMIGPAMGLGVVATEGNLPPHVLPPQQERCSGGCVDLASRDWHAHLAAVRFHSRRQHCVLDHVGHDRNIVVHRVYVDLCRVDQAALLPAGCAPSLQDSRRDRGCLDRGRSGLPGHGVDIRHKHAADRWCPHVRTTVYCDHDNRHSSISTAAVGLREAEEEKLEDCWKEGSASSRNCRLILFSILKSTD